MIKKKSLKESSVSGTKIHRTSNQHAEVHSGARLALGHAVWEWLTFRGLHGTMRKHFMHVTLLSGKTAKLLIGFSPWQEQTPHQQQM